MNEQTQTTSHATTVLPPSESHFIKSEQRHLGCSTRCYKGRQQRVSLSVVVFAAFGKCAKQRQSI